MLSKYDIHWLLWFNSCLMLFGKYVQINKITLKMHLMNIYYYDVYSLLFYKFSWNNIKMLSLVYIYIWLLLAYYRKHVLKLHCIVIKLVLNLIKLQTYI